VEEHAGRVDQGLDDPTVERPPPFRPPAPGWARPAPAAPTPSPPPPTPSTSPGLPPPPLPRSQPPGPVEPVLPDAPPTYDASPFGGPGRPLPPLPAYARPEPEPGRERRLPAALLVAASALIAALVTGALFLAFDRDPTTTAAAPSARLEGSSGLDIQALLQKAQPSVVTIHTDESTSGGRSAGAGTGVIINTDGDIITNAHVVNRATTVRVTLDDGTEYPAEVIGSFPDADVAMVRVQGAADLVPAELGTSADVRVGDEVVAIGNALNLGASPSVTRGIISALDRIIEAPDVTLHGLIQTDAAINPGNSGGPLLNAAGAVVGINTAIAADAQSIGFAIPIDDIKPLIDELKEGRGEITPDTAFLGVSSVSVSELTTDQLDQFGISASRGAVVTEISPDSPAADAGLEVGDVIVGIDGQSISSAAEVVEAIRNRQEGDEITIEYERDGRKRTTDATLSRRGG
jgi:putative serine protease PepD